MSKKKHVAGAPFDTRPPDCKNRQGICRIRRILTHLRIVSTLCVDMPARTLRIIIKIPFWMLKLEILQAGQPFLQDKQTGVHL